MKLTDTTDDHDTLEQIAGTDVTVLLGGETGSGKGRLAKDIHHLSPRTSKPFVSVDCTSIPETLFESQLFGARKGAFTGADSDRLGLVRSAHSGTLFLDEIGELSLDQQAKFLTLLQERSVLPVGATERVPVDVRLIAATNRDLRAMVERGEFREDLYYRLAVIELSVAPLRERMDELDAIIEDLIDQRAQLLRVTPRSPSAEYLECLHAHDWPGNVRELGNVIERSLVLSRGQHLDPETLPPELRAPVTHRGVTHTGSTRTPTPETVNRAIDACGGNKSAAARRLGISRRHLYRLMHATVHPRIHAEYEISNAMA